jgi:uncharacterized membrane protein YccC
MILSRKAKEAIKTALAMTIAYGIAYGIALSMDWGNPMWAGFAVAFVSLATVGQSLNKAALRMLGTLVAVVLALALIALFAQERWLFILFVAAWVGLCTYMMSGQKFQYFWHVSAFVTVIICFDAGPDSVNAFSIATLRGQETGLGILVYGLVAVLLWPSDSRADFEVAVAKFASTQHQLYRVYYDLMQGKTDGVDVHSLRSSAIQEQPRFNQLLASAQTESYEVWEVRRQWRRYQGLVSELAEVLEQWRESFDELQTLDLHTLFPNLAAFHAEMDRRFDQIEGMLDGQEPAYQPVSMELDLDKTGLARLSHFHKAALTVSRSRMHHLELLMRSLFESTSDIKGFARRATRVGEVANVQDGFVLDPERMLGAIRAMLIVWIACLGWFYVEGIPGGSTLVMISTSIGMAMATMPQVPVSRLFVPAAVSVMFAGLVYIFVMPQLSSFWGLGMLLFAATFAICYLFAAPQQMLGRAMGLAMFVVIISVSNQQSYSFFAVANIAMVFPLLFVILAITAYIPYSPLPEKVFLRLLARFFKSAEYLISTLGQDPGQPLTRQQRRRKQFYAREVATLPRKLGMWGKMIGPRLLPHCDAKQVQALVTNLQAMSYRISDLVDARRLPQADALVVELTQDMRQWRLAIQALFRRWSEQPSAGSEHSLEDRLNNRLSALEERISESFERTGEGRLKREDYQNFYRLLGSYRGVSEALVAYSRLIGAMNLMQWRENRF